MYASEVILTAESCRMTSEITEIYMKFIIFSAKNYQEAIIDKIFMKMQLISLKTLTFDKLCSKMYFV